MMHIIEKSGLQTMIDKPDAFTTYIGLSASGIKTTNSKWMIKKIYKSGTITQISFANHEVLFNKKWTDRKTYNYKID